MQSYLKMYGIDTSKSTPPAAQTTPTANTTPTQPTGTGPENDPTSIYYTGTQPGPAAAGTPAA